MTIHEQAERIRQAQSEPGNGGNQSSFRSVSIQDFLNADFPARETIINPWMLSQTLSMVYSLRGVGKTHFSIGVAASIVTGTPFLKPEWTAKRSGVLFIDGEMPGIVLQQRFAQALKLTGADDCARLQIISPDIQSGRMPNLAEKSDQDMLESHLEGVKLVIVDNISTLVRTDDVKGEAWISVQEWCLHLRKNGVSVLLIHHSGKNGTQRGTSRREDILDTVIALRHPGDYTPNQGCRFELHFEKSRGVYGDSVRPFEASYDSDRGWTTRKIEDVLEDRIQELLDEGLNQSDISEILNINRSTVSRRIKAMKRHT